MRSIEVERVSEKPDIVFTVPDHLRTPINRLERLRHKIATYKERFLAHCRENPIQNSEFEARVEAARASLADITTDNQGVDAFLKKLLGIYQLDDELIAYMPPSAVEVKQRQYAEKTEDLWVYALVGEESYKDRVENFRMQYVQVAQALGLFPFPPTLEAIANQRMMQRSVRDVATMLVAINMMREYGSVEAGINQIIAYANTALSLYREADIRTLQLVYQRKTGINMGDMQALKDKKIWDNNERLSFLCLDAGVRDLLLGCSSMVESVTSSRLLAGLHTTRTDIRRIKQDKDGHS